MRLSALTLLAFAAGAIGAPQGNILLRQAPGSCTTPVKIDAKTNVWDTYKLHANGFYRAEVQAAAAGMTGAAKEAALRIADVGTFLWV